MKEQLKLYKKIKNLSEDVKSNYSTNNYAEWTVQWILWVDAIDFSTKEWSAIDIKYWYVNVRKKLIWINLKNYSRSVIITKKDTEWKVVEKFSIWLWDDWKFLYIDNSWLKENNNHDITDYVFEPSEKFLTEKLNDVETYMKQTIVFHTQKELKELYDASEHNKDK